jgi:sensor histidine kinase regulating citrate/malate metabolism
MLIVAVTIPHTAVYSVFITAGLLYFNIIIFDFFENYSARIRLKETETIINNNKKNYQILKNNEQDLRILKHDINKHINIIKDLLKTNDIDSVNKYVEALDHVAASIDSVTYTNHITLDSILNIESAKAKAADIRYFVKSNIQSDINIEDIDLTTILCNAIDNAIEAAAHTEKRYVVITINVYSDYIDFIIDNSYNTILVHDDSFKTTKEDTINHGFGISSITKAVAKYDGKIQNERISGINTMKIRMVNR